ncbi:VCBS repeat-containing protein [Streptomyces sp. NPDC002057]|uniref:FG-GAP repeat domain-containing protein n=1 Tax=Streptomyces sp. NPDC002057 TaxID=3154664 RepID=UPI00332FE6CC
MNRPVRPRRATLRRVLGTALIPVVGLGVAATDAPAAFAAPSGITAAAPVEFDPWAPSTPLSDGTGWNGVHAVETARNGAVVALTYRESADGMSGELGARVRPAGSTVWGAPQLLSAADGRQNPQLLAAPDGAVVATWEVNNALKMAVLEPGATTWSAATDIATEDLRSTFRLAGSPSGTLVATWVRHMGEGVYASVRTAPGEAWSEPVRLSDAAPSWYFVHDVQLIVSDRGTATVAFTEDSRPNGATKVIDLLAGGKGWGKPVTVSASGRDAGPVILTRGPDGRAALLWEEKDPASGETTQVFAQRPAGSLTWGPREATPGRSPGPWEAVAFGPEGDVTLLGNYEYEDDGFSARTTTRSAATGKWSPVQLLDGGYGRNSSQFDLAIGPDGNAHAIWTRWDDDGSGPRGSVMASSRVNGVWSANSTLLSNPADRHGVARVTVDADGRPVAVFGQDSGSGSQLRTATTAPARVKPRDFSGDGRGDLIARTSTGTLTVRTGTGTGGLGTGASAAGWPASSTVVPFGDLSGDGCNDLLVRDAGGRLSRYDGGCGKAFSPNGTKVLFGGGWNVYDQLAAPGDLTGDGRPDLLARTPAGDLFLYAADRGKFEPPVKAGFGWQTYNAIVGTGDLTGDRADDLIARDKAGVLWSYQGTGRRGGLNARVKVGGGWQIYDSVVGVGDITNDGRADLVARDKAGVLWRYAGNGTGTFAPRVRIGGGWQMYKTLS